MANFRNKFLELLAQDKYAVGNVNVQLEIINVIKNQLKERREKCQIV